MEIYAALLRATFYQKSRIDPLQQISKADVIFGAIVGSEFVGFASINRFASPDNLNNDGSDVWFEDSVVRPDLHRRGIWSKLQKRRFAYAPQTSGRIFTASIAPWRDASLRNAGWQECRVTHDKHSDILCRVFEFPRSRLM